MTIESVYRRVGKAPLDDVRHTHIDQYEIIQTWTDGGSVLIGDRLFPMTGGGVYLINAINIHMTNPGDPARYERSVVKFSSGWMRNLLGYIGAEPMLSFIFDSGAGAYFALDSEKAAEADRIFMAIGMEDSSGVGRLTHLMSLMKLLYDSSESGPFGSRADCSAITNSVLSEINARYAEPITLDYLSETIHVSKYHMCRVFASETGISIAKYILLYRVVKAKKALEETNLPISAVSQMCGFQSAANFSAAFRRCEGMTPLGYRRLMNKMGDKSSTSYLQGPSDVI